jgi:hypothetical protein
MCLACAGAYVVIADQVSERIASLPVSGGTDLKVMAG